MEPTALIKVWHPENESARYIEFINTGCPCQVERQCCAYNIAFLYFNEKESKKLDITWFGRRCFSIRSRDLGVVTDPYDQVQGKVTRAPYVKAVTWSGPPTGPLSLFGGEGQGRAQGEEWRAIQGPGEYEIAEVLITGVGTAYKSGEAENGAGSVGRNTVYAIEMDGIVVCHLGDLQRPLESGQVERLGDVGVMVAPIGSVESVRASVETARLVEPKVVVPMDYPGPEATDSEALTRFLKEMGVTAPEGQRRLHVTASSMPEQTQVALLENSG